MMFSIANAAEASSFSNMLAESPIAGFIPFILIFAVFYFFIIRPQVKKQKQHQEVINNLKRGDKIITNGGILGTITKIEETQNIFHVEISPNVKIKLLKNAVASMVIDNKNPTKEEATKIEENNEALQKVE